jgi:hypothetical protein
LAKVQQIPPDLVGKSGAFIFVLCPNKPFPFSLFIGIFREGLIVNPVFSALARCGNGQGYALVYIPVGRVFADECFGEGKVQVSIKFSAGIDLSPDFPSSS